MNAVAFFKPCLPDAKLQRQNKSYTIEHSQKKIEDKKKEISWPKRCIIISKGFSNTRNCKRKRSTLRHWFFMEQQHHYKISAPAIKFCDFVIVLLKLYGRILLTTNNESYRYLPYLFTTYRHMYWVN